MIIVGTMCARLKAMYSLWMSLLRIKMFDQCIHQFASTKTHYISSWQSCLIFCALYRLACLLVVEMMGHEREANDFAWALWTHPTHSIFVKLNHATQRRQRTMIISFNSG